MIAFALALSLAGTLLCWRGWSRQALRPLVAAAALLSAGSTALWITAFGAEIGIPLALETAALIAFGFILTRIERRPAQAVRERVVAAPPPRSRWLGIARFLNAGLLGFAAAMAIGVLLATRAPLAEQTRLILAALAMPSLWCAAIVWTACDRRLALQASMFLGLASTGAGLTFATA